jgi:uncharacterized membrane protein
MRRSNLFAFLAVMFAVALAPAAALAGGPLYLYDPATGTPIKYKAPVKVYTDMGTLGILSNEAADAKVAFAWQQWTDVETSSFEAAVEGDFASIGLGDITAANAEQVFGTYNGGGVHVVYDTDGTIMRDYFGVGTSVLGIATPEFGAEGSNEILESWVILNGRSIGSSDPNGNGFAGVMTHEFGHSINLAHSQTNGAILFYGDARGPSGCTSLPYSGSPAVDDLETMYPFINPTQTGAAQSTVDHPDDIASISNIYPAPGWESNYGTISGTITTTDGETQVTGINVIARNVASPWRDAVSAVSGDFSQGRNGADGRYTFRGLTPGAQYVVYVDGIVQGGFSTPPAFVFPGPEEFFSGASESGDALADVACNAEPITAGAGVTYTADIAFNAVEGAPGLHVIGPNVQATDISADGSVVVGSVTGADAPAFRWTRESGLEIIGGTGGLVSVTSDGSTISGNAPDESGFNRAAIWQGGTSWLAVAAPAGTAPCDNLFHSSYGISDGGDVVGLAYVGGCAGPRAFRFDASTGEATTLETPSFARQSRANGITRDGSTVFGWYTSPTGQRLGAIWQDGLLTPMSTAQVTVGEPTAISGDGTTLVGGGAPGGQAYRWTLAGGLEAIGRLPGFGGALGFGANYDGSVVVGSSGFAFNRDGFLWTPALGMMKLDDFLASQGTFLAGWKLGTPGAVSDDGRTIAGWGFSPNAQIAFVVDIPKVRLCHAPPGNPNNARTIEVEFPGSLDDHLEHGDTVGPCECESTGNGR